MLCTGSDLTTQDNTERSSGWSIRSNPTVFTSLQLSFYIFPEYEWSSLKAREFLMCLFIFSLDTMDYLQSYLKMSPTALIGKESISPWKSQIYVAWNGQEFDSIDTDV